jgi:superfamily II DNA/RNA helicase
MDELLLRYKRYIRDRYQDLILSGKNKNNLNNFDLAKIFEYYSCIKLTEEYNQIFYEYSDIEPNFKELHNLSKNDTGIDACNLLDTVVQCKLREDSLSWKECSTFFGSNVILNGDSKLSIKWEKMIITRNKNSKLSTNLKLKNNLFLDKTYDKDEIINYCENLILDKNIIKKEKIEIRDYQKETIKLIKDMRKNLIINLPTGTGKNFIIAHAIHPQKFSYLILVPRIILLEQIETEIIKFNYNYKKYIQRIGDKNNKYDKNKNITICVYNSVKIIDNYIKDFDYIIVDEAHHIITPNIYNNDNNDVNSNDDYESNNDDSNDDSTDEENDDSYIQMIKSYQKYNNNIYLSATIDKINNFDYYSKDIRDMIDNKYLCDYIITVPIFTDDPTNKNICEYLIKNYRNIIIYCDSQEEGKKINNIMNKIQHNSSEYIDCTTSKTIRNNIINKYKTGKLPFIVNVRILIEGFDAPITKGICFMHMPSSKTSIIQIIGRALRLHEEKNIANIILPFSNKYDEENINHFLKILAENDSRVKKSFINKKIGGYIDIVKCVDNINNESLENNIELRYEMIYDKIGVLKNFEYIWTRNLEEVKKYIDENNKRPSTIDNNKNIKYLGIWLAHQQKNYLKYQQIMSNENIRDIWTNFINNDKYKKYFLSNEQEWKNNLEEVKKYINVNNKRPSSEDKDKNIKYLGNWILHQQRSYLENQMIMSNNNIRDIWKNFINDEKYKQYFLSNEHEWKNNLEEVKKYIDENNKRPSNGDENIIIKKMSKWICTQQCNYTKKTKKYVKNIFS